MSKLRLQNLCRAAFRAEQEFTQQGISFEPEKKLPIYEGDRLLGFYIPDFIIENKVILEIKAFATVHQKYLGQVITYLNHTGLADRSIDEFWGTKT